MKTTGNSILDSKHLTKRQKELWLATKNWDIIVALELLVLDSWFSELSSKDLIINNEYENVVWC